MSRVSVLSAPHSGSAQEAAREAAMHAVVEHSFDCPYCGESITMLLDPGPGVQVYVEDCEVCCNPIEVTFRVEGEAVVEFAATSLD